MPRQSNSFHARLQAACARHGARAFSRGGGVGRRRRRWTAAVEGTEEGTKEGAKEGHSEALRSTQKRSEALRSTQKHSEALRSTQKHSPEVKVDADVAVVHERGVHLPNELRPEPSVSHCDGAALVGGEAL